MEGPLSPEDFPALVGWVCIAILATSVMAWRIFSLTSLACDFGPRLVLSTALVSCQFALILVLTFYAAREVRESLGYRILFVAAAAVEIELVSRGMSVLGLGPLEDGLERNNRAARFAAVGVWVACTLGAIGSNLGEGDEIYTTLIPMTLAATGLLAMALLASIVTRGFKTVVVERDDYAGMRLGAFFISAGLPLAQAASGDWVSLTDTLVDYGVACVPEGILIGLFLLVEGCLSRDPDHGSRPRSFWSNALLPTAAYLALPLIWWRLFR
jgi:hypothetical protein